MIDTDPSNLAIADNTMESYDIFQFRKYWKNFTKESFLLDETADLWYDKKLFGKLNHRGDIIYLSETNLKEYRNTPAGQTIMGVDFVVDAFTDLQSHFTKALAGQKLNISGDPAIQNMSPKKGWVSIHQSYNRFLEEFTNMLVSGHFKSNAQENQIVDLPSYVKTVLELFDGSGGTLPVLSQSALILSSMYPVHGCGLVVEIADTKPAGKDSPKYAWTQDVNYEFYKASAQNHGFMIDANQPWRLIADIQHPVMAKHMEKYSVTAQNLFEKYYYQSYRFDLENLRDYFFDSYRMYCQSYPVFIETTPNLNPRLLSSSQTTKYKAVERHPVDPDSDEAEELYPDPYWLELTYYIRLRELGIDFTPAAFNRSVKEIIQIYNRFGLDNALKYANMLIKKNRITIL